MAWDVLILMRKIHFEGHWKGWAPKIDTFLSPEMAMSESTYISTIIALTTSLNSSSSSFNQSANGLLVSATGAVLLHWRGPEEKGVGHCGRSWLLLCWLLRRWLLRCWLLRRFSLPTTFKYFKNSENPS